jgi:O-acetyl-ADP-ribose deacetylase (regulator of RNase III)
MDIAGQRGLRSIAFPSISTGAYRFPVDRASRIAIREITEGLRRHPNIERAVCVCFDEATLRQYQGALGELAHTASEGSAP